MIIHNLNQPWRLPLVCLAFLLVSRSTISAQSLRSAPYYSPDAPAMRQKLAEETAASIRAKFQEPEQFDKEARKAYQERRDQMAENIAADIGRMALPDDALWIFVKNTQAAIVAANPECAGTKIILTVHPVPNAYSIGEGTIVIHSGLLAGLENEDQLAFVLCHEIAHFLLEHATKGLAQEIKTFYSKEFKDQVKAAKAVEFHQNEQLESIFKNALFNTRYHRRDLERQADSLAYRLFLKTRFAPGQAQQLMQLFEYIDEPLRDSTLQLATHFGCGEFPFQQHWLEAGRGSVWEEAQLLQSVADKPLEDSVSTHPDWKNRLHWIEAMARLLPADTLKVATQEDQYAPVRYLSAIESVERWFQVERYDKALYYALLYQDVYPACSYFGEVQVLSLCGLYTHSKGHTLADVLSQGSPDYPKKYNQFLGFLNNLRLKDLLALQACSLQRLTAQKTEYGLLAEYCVAMNLEDRAKMGTIKKAYLSTYRKGRFVDFFKN